MGVGKRNSMYRYRVVYPLEVETECSICGCAMRVIIFTCQQRTAKMYCRAPCSAKRMTDVKLLWAASWDQSKPNNKQCQQEYLNQLRKMKGISQEAVDATAMLPALY